MRKVTAEELKEILEKHRHWWNEDCDGWEDMCADLQGADLRGADLQGAHNIPFIPKTCPDTGAFIGWKKARLQGGASAIVKLRISEDAKRTSGTGRKCRCDKAEVLEIWSVDAETRELKAKYQEAYSSRDISFTYRVGETVTPTKPFDECRWNECSSGIHFFINLQEAIEY